MKNLVTLGERLRYALITLELNQSQAAKICNVPPTSLGDVMNNKEDNYKFSGRIAKALNINVDWLLFGTGNITNPVVYYAPLINSHHRLGLYLEENIVDHDVPHLSLDQYYGKFVFATTFESEHLICRPVLNELETCDGLDLLFWSSSDKIIVPSNTIRDKSKVYAIYEYRRYSAKPVGHELSNHRHFYPPKRITPSTA